jgi:ABC-2 type transport system ATP-binding protein
MEHPALALRGLGKDYGRRTAVGAIDLDVRAGECFGLLGNNGAGKTTTLSMACGVVTPTRGTVTIAGIDLATSSRTAKARLGVVPQELALYDELPADENLRYFGALYGLSAAELEKRVAWSLAKVGLSDRARDLVKTYSGGMKRRLNLAAGLVHAPTLLILDEPTVGVDPQSRRDIHDIVRALVAEGTTVVYSSHYLDEVETMCDRVAIMDAGKIVALGTVAELTAKHAQSASLELSGSPEVIEAAMAAAKRAALEAGATVERAEASASLESAFLALTGHAPQKDDAP